MHHASGKDILSSICLNKLHSHGKTAFISFILTGSQRQNIAHKTPGLLNIYLQSQPQSKQSLRN